MRREVIALIGRQGSGKTFQANKLVNERKFMKLSFADPLREIAFNVIGMDFDEGMSKYAELKQTEIVNGLNFRNILENLGASVRKFDKDFWARALVTKVNNTQENIVIDDMRYPNEYVALKNYCSTKGIAYNAYYCDYKSAVYDESNPHESAGLSNYLSQIGYNNLQLVDYKDICGYISLSETNLGKNSSELFSPLETGIETFHGNMNKLGKAVLNELISAYKGNK